MMNDLIKAGLNTLVKHDAYLLESNANERSITHRLGVYYELIFPDWDVDCEFNRNLGGPKKIVIDPRMFLDKMADRLRTSDNHMVDDDVLTILQREDVSVEDIGNLSEQLREPGRLEYDSELDVVHFVLTLRNKRKLRKTIYPDIIVHKRSTTNNHIVIEAKKSSNTDPMDRAYDLVKLITLVRTKDFNYDRGFFVDIPVESRFLSHDHFKFEKDSLDGRVYKVQSTGR